MGSVQKKSNKKWLVINVEHKLGRIAKMNKWDEIQ